MGNIYRKASLDRLASPEQLDKMIRIASPSLWIAVAGAVLVVVSVLGWAIFGSLPENASVNGIYMSDTSVRSAYASYGGTVEELLVSKNQQVEAGDVVAVVTNSSLNSNAQQIKDRMEAVEKITLTSEGDVSTSDTAQLLEYKIQYSHAGLTLEQKQATLAALNAQLAEAKQKVSQYRSQMDAAEDAYLNAVGNDTINNASYHYQQAQARLQTAQNNYSPLFTEQQNLNNNITSLEASMASLSEQIAAEEDEIQMALLQNQLAEMDAQRTQYKAALPEVNTALANAKAELDSAQEAYNAAEEAYGNAYSTQNAETANKTRLNTDFSEASQLYSNAYSQQLAIEREIASMNTDVSLAGDSMQVDKNTLEQQFNGAKTALLNSLNAELQSTYDSGAREEIRAEVSGTVIDCGVQKGQMVAQGSELLKIKSGDEEDSEIIRCYAPVAEGKKMQAGMTAVMTPATVDETEYGHINGEVKYVGTYSVSAVQMQQALGNDPTVEALLQQGPCVEVLLSLDKDPDTASGYKWSNHKGEQLTLEENTPMTVKVRIKEEAPIQKLIPFLKSKLDVEVKTSADH